MNYGNKIAELRKGKNLTQAELGAHLNVTAQAVSKWENDLSEPDIDSIRKMCELFGISVDDFLGLKKPEEVKEEKENQTEQIKIISGYCEKCGKPVSPNEYEITHLHYDKNTDNVYDSEKQYKHRRGRKVLVNNTVNQHIYCNDCFNEIIKMKQEQDAANEQARKVASYNEKKRMINRGLIWATVICVIANAIVWSVYAFSEDKNAYFLGGSIVIAISSFTFTAQMFWDSWILGVMAFFCRSFTAPFGFIFSFDLDGMICFLITKLAMGIFLGLLSAAFFLLGLIFCLYASIIGFGFSLGANLSELRKIKNA